MEEIEGSEVKDFLCVKSLQFFKAFNLSADFLSYHRQYGCQMMAMLKEKRKQNS